MTTSPFAFFPHTDVEPPARIAAHFEALATGPRRRRDLHLWLLTQLDELGPDAWCRVTDYYAGAPSPAVRTSTRRAISELLRDGAIEVQTVEGERLGWRTHALAYEDSLLLRVRLEPSEPSEPSESAASDGPSETMGSASADDAGWESRFFPQETESPPRIHEMNVAAMGDQPRLTDPATLQGSRVRLEPLGAQHLESLRDNLQHGDLWTNPYTFVPHPNDLNSFLDDALRAQEAARELTFATIDISTGEVVGSTRYRSMDHDHRRTEIGFTFIAPPWQRTHINTEAKYLMLRNAFDIHNYMRVEFVTDARNQQSRAAIARLGATQEGVLRHHMLLRDGNPRDSALYSIIAPDWAEALRRRLEDKLAGANTVSPDNPPGSR